MTFEQLAVHYQEVELPSKAYSTQEGYKNYLDLHVLPKWGQHSLSSIKAVEVEAWLRGLKTARGKPASPGTRTKTLIPSVISEELAIHSQDLEKSFALRALGGNVSNGSVYFNFWSSGPAADRWQVLSPVKGQTAGTIMLNRLIQAGFRGEARKLAQREDRRYAKVPGPLGSDGIIYGDKVINLRNRRRPNVFPDQDSAGFL